MMIVKKFGVLSVANISGILSAIMGLIFGILWAAMVSTVASRTGGMDPMFPGMELLGEGAIWIMGTVFATIFYGVVGFLSGLIGAALYNVFAKRIGGIKVELLTSSEVE